MECPAPNSNDLPSPGRRASLRGRAARRPGAAALPPASGMPSRPGVRPARRRRTVLVLVIGAAMAILMPVAAAAGVSGPAGPPPAISWATCGIRLECARVPVPLDWAHPGGRVITPPVIRHLASRPGHLSSADPSACVTHALGSYLVSLTTPPRGTICPSDHLPFDPGFGQPAVARGGAALAH
jgi:hypothetical protein